MKRITKIAAAALIASGFILSSQAQAAMALAFSQSAPTNNNNAVVTNVASETEAKQTALNECKRVTGKNDCKVILSSIKQGYGALYAACVSSNECLYSFATGYPSNRNAHDYVLAACKRDYGVDSCFPWKDWQETAGQSSSPSSAAKSPTETGGTSTPAEASTKTAPPQASVSKQSQNANKAGIKEAFLDMPVKEKTTEKLPASDIQFNSLCGSAQRKAISGDTDAQIELSTCYTTSENGGVKNKKLAGFWLRKSAELGNPKAQYFLAVALMRGDKTLGIKQDLDKLPYWLVKSADQGYGDAIAFLQTILESKK